MGNCNNEYLDLIIGLLSFLLFVSEYLGSSKKCDCNSILHAIFPDKCNPPENEAETEKIKKILKDLSLDNEV
jgi:hypothetical protein